MGNTTERLGQNSHMTLSRTVDSKDLEKGFATTLTPEHQQKGVVNMNAWFEKNPKQTIPKLGLKQKSPEAVFSPEMGGEDPKIN